MQARVKGSHKHGISSCLLSPSGFRLKEIQMSEYDAATYERFSGAVQRQVHALRVILDNLQVAFPRTYTKNSWGKLFVPWAVESHFRIDT